MEFGIFRHGPIKTALTRGRFKNIFQPLLFSDSDRLHYSFVETVTNQLKYLHPHIQEGYLNKTSFWLHVAPRQLFEFIFLPDEDGHTVVPVLNGDIEPLGEKCTHISQAFVLWNLEQMLKNSKDFQKELGLSIEHFEMATHDSLIGRSEIHSYLEKYRKDFGDGNVDPRDWVILYVWDICDVLIPDERELMKVMKDWNEDELAKRALTSAEIRFFAGIKKHSLNL